MTIESSVIKLFDEELLLITHEVYHAFPTYMQNSFN